MTMEFVELVTLALNDPFLRDIGEGSTCICSKCKVRYKINSRELEYYRLYCLHVLKGNHQKLCQVDISMWGLF